MVDVSERFKVEDGWEEVEDMDEYFTFKEIGDCVYGAYINKETGVGVNRATVYTLKKSEEEIKIFGTVAINKKMEDTPLNWEVGIIYLGEKPSKPPKKPYKMFKVFRRNPNKSKAETKSDNFLADEQAVKWIDTITDDLIEEGVEPTERKILIKAKDYHIEKVDGLTPEMLGRIEKELKRKG